MDTIFRMVWTTSIYAGTVGLILITLKAIIKNKISPKWHYFLWVVLIVKLLIPFGPESAISLFNVMQPVAEEMNFARSYEQIQPTRDYIYQADHVNDQIPATEVRQRSSMEWIERFEKKIPYIWFWGAIILLTWFVCTNYTFTKRLKISGSVAPEAILCLLENCKKASGIRKNIEIVVQDVVKTPALIDVFHPKILLTPAILNLNEQKISFILLHELAHYKRKDLLANYLLLALQVIHWFNPVIWYCFIKIRQDMEVAADENVLALLDAKEHKEYGKALLAVLDSFSITKRLAPRLMGMVDDKKNIERRIKMIKMTEFFQSKKRKRIFTGIICLVILGGVLWTSASAQLTWQIGDYTLNVPPELQITGSETELFFQKDNNPVGGVQILNYEPDQPLVVPNHSVIKSNKDIEGLITKAAMLNLDLTQPAGAGDDTIKNENHLYLLFAQEKKAYDIYVNTQYINETELLEIGKSLQKVPKSQARKYADTEYNVGELLEDQTDYVGDNVKVVHLIDGLPLPYEYTQREVSLQTEKEPYGVTVNYHFGTENTKSEQMIPALRKNALLLFALIKNVDVLNFYWDSAGEKHEFSITRAELQESYPRDLREYAQDEATLETLLNGNDLALVVFPERYTPAMSSTPGIKIEVQYNGTADQVKYSVNRGNLLTWDSTSGNISERGKMVELPLTIPVYWSPIEGYSVKYQENDEIPVKISILNKNSIAAEKQLKIGYDGLFYYPVNHIPDDFRHSETTQISAQTQTSIEKAVSLAIKDQGKGYLDGEVATEGHVILLVEEKEGLVIAYTVASFSWFGFENNVFTGISGSGAIPTVITFSKNEKDEYSLLEYKEPTDGEGYLESIQEMFPGKLWDTVLHTDHYPELAHQKEAQAKGYLQSIGRSAEVKVGYVEKQLVDINVQASNKLFAEFTKRNFELNNFPYWLGTKEYLIKGERFIYQTSQSKSSDGYDLISFEKTKEDGTVVLKYQYKIVGSEPQLLSLQSFPELKQ